MYLWEPLCPLRVENVMSHPTLQQLDHRTVAIELTVNQTTRILKGTGQYEPDSELGPVLKIALDDEGGLELMLKEREWTGSVASGERFGCDYALRLDASSLCSK